MVSILVALLSLMSTGYAINRPVYKVVLTQKGFAQFIQYDVETPPLREFTFCTWIRIYELVNDQTIFSYIAQRNNRVVRLWLDSEGHLLKLSINGRETVTHVDNVKDVWKHVCLSYQSDFGAWALYIDARLLSCGMAQSLSGYVLPGGGSIIVGYGTDQNGIPNGLEGEIFGANMILKSTIDRNVTLRNDPTKRQKHFLRNKIKERNKGLNYIVLSDLQTDEVHNNYEMSSIPPFINFSQNYIQFSTPHSFIAHSVGSDLSKTRNIKARDKAITNTYLDFTVSDKEDTTFWNTFHQDRPTTLSGLKIQKNTLTPFDIIGVPKISEFETPPPLVTIKPDIYSTTKPRIIETYKIDEDFEGNTSYGKEVSREISLVETPPPPVKNNKVYGQWTSSKFASSVLNYLKSINYHKRENKKVPATIPLKKINDNFPYASELNHMKIRPPLQFLNKNIIEKRSDSNKRQPQINVKILENDLRSLILKSHGNTEVRNVEIMNRGESQNNINRKHRHADTNENDEISGEYNQPKPFTVPTEEHTHSSKTALDDSNLLSILPFLKSLEYFVKDSEDAESTKVFNNDMYLKSLSNKNKWHTIKTYNNNYTPRYINLDSNNNQDELKHKIADENNNKHPSVRLKYISEGRVLNADDPSILQGRTLAQEVSNRSNGILENESINKYNQGYLPGHNKNIKIDDIHRSVVHRDTSITQTGNSFGRHVKLGNALNERHVLGDSEKQKEQSFVGGYDSIPDINRYRSDIDNESSSAKVLPSLGIRICKYTGLAEFKGALYAKPDGSIDNTDIISPVKKKNIGIEFITQNYKTCSLAESYLENSEMLFIDWSKTPVRLFGGAYAKTTTDLCGFF